MIATMNMKMMLFNWLNSFFIMRNERCPCGSEKTYGECCYNKKDKKIPVEQAAYYAAKMLRDCLLRFVFIQTEKSVMGGTLNIHMPYKYIRILSKLAVGGHVWMLDPKKTPLIISNGEDDIDTI